MTKPPRTKEEQFWLDIRRAFLELVNAIEVGKLCAHIDVPTSQVRKLLRDYAQGYPLPARDDKILDNGC